MKYEEFLMMLVTLQDYFGKILKDEVVGLYWNLLKNITVEDFKAMVARLIETYHPTAQNPFPLISDFLEAGGLSGQKRAVVALNAVLSTAKSLGAWSSVDFGDPALHATIMHFGGWPEVCSWGNKGQWQFNEKKFIEAYLAISASGESAGPVKGNFEIGNHDVDTSAWNQKQIEVYNRHNTPRKIQWVGADFSHQIENKAMEVKQIRGGEPEKVMECLKDSKK
jgi:hypothetical protein